MLGASGPLTGVPAQLASAHRRSAAKTGSLRSDLDGLLQARERPALFERWRDFALNTITDEQITSALREARSRL